jgi:hypothetical protein
MSVLKKIQFAGQALGIDAVAIIGAGVAECQKPAGAVGGAGLSPCFTAAH